MSTYDDVYGAIVNGTESLPEQKPDKGFIGNLVSDIKDTTMNYLSTAKSDVSALENISIADYNSGDPVKDIQDYQEARQKALGSIGTDVVQPPLGAAAFVNPYAAAAYLPYLTQDVGKSVQEQGALATARNFTYGQAVDFATQENLGQKFYDKPFSVGVQGLMSVLPPVLIGRGIYKGVKSKIGKSGEVTGEIAGEPQTLPEQQAPPEQQYSPAQSAVDMEQQTAQNAQVILDNIYTSIPKVTETKVPTPEEIKAMVGANGEAMPQTEQSQSGNTIDTGHADIDSIINSTAQKYDVDPSLVAKIVKQESSFDPNATSSEGAQGLMQLMPDTAKELGVENSYDPAQNIDGGVRYIKQLIDENNGDVHAALSQYYGGKGNMGLPESQQYADGVLNQDVGQVTSTENVQPLTQKYYNISSEVSDTNLTNLTEQKLNLIARDYQNKYGEALDVTSEKRSGNGDSWHDSGQAVDLVSNRLANDPEARAWLVEEGKKYGLAGRDEYSNPSEGATAGHVHFSDHGEPLSGSYKGAGDTGTGAGKGSEYSSKSAEDFASKTDRMKAESDLQLNDVEKSIGENGWKETSNQYLERVSKEQDQRASETTKEITDSAAKEVKTDDQILDDHKNVVEQALQQGKDVPEHVLDEYPDLINQYKVPQGEGYTPLKEGQYGSLGNTDVSPARPETIKNVTAPEVNRQIKQFVQTYTGKVGSKAFEGLYDAKGYARVRSYGDFDTAAHEIGHAIDDTLKIQGYNGELVSAASKIWGDNKVFQGYDNVTKRAEGIAEFGRQYLLNRFHASQNFPMFFKAFEESLKNNPEFAKKVNGLSNTMRNWYSQSPEARARGMTSFGNELPKPSIKDRLNVVMDKAQTAWVNKLHGLDKLTKKAESYLAKDQMLKYEDNPSLQARTANTSPIGRSELMFGIKVKDPKLMTDVMNEAYDNKIKYVVTMKDIFNTIRDDAMNKKYPTYLKDGNMKDWQEALGTYVGVNRAVELHQTKFETPLKDAQDILTNAKTAYQESHDKYNSIAESIKQNKKATGKNYYIDAGETKSLNEARQSEIQAKADLRRAQNAVKHLQDMGYKTHISMEDAKKIVDNAPQELKDAAEKTYQYNDNLLSIQESSGLISSALHRELEKYKSYVPMARDFSEEGGIEGAFGGGGKDYVNVSSVLKKISDTGSTRIVKNPLEQMIANTHKVLDAAERNKVGQSIVRLNKIPEMEKYIVELPEGTTADSKNAIFTVMFNGKKKAYQTIPEFYEGIKNLNEPSFNAFTRFLAPFAKALRIGATGVNPSFIVANMVKDNITASIYSKSMMPVVSTLEGIKSMTKDTKLVYEFRASGAPMAALVGMDRPGIQSRIKVFTSDGKISDAPKTDQLKWIAENMLEAARKVSETSESSTRITRFKKERQAGKSIGESGLAAKDITVDFSRSGVLGQQANQIIPFFNAVIQGGDRFIRAFKADPNGTTWRMGKYIVLPTVALYTMNYDQDWYKKQEAYVKDSYWLFSPDGGETIIRIPKPQESGILFGSVIERALDQMNGIDPIGMKRWSKDAFDAFAPNFLPTAIQPIIEWVANYSFFTGKPIVDQRDQQHSTAMQYNAYTTELAKKLGWATGTSPEKIDNTINGYLGGAGKFISSALNPVLGDTRTMPNKGVSDIPGASRFLVNGNFTQSQSVNDFYDTYERMHQEYSDSGKKKPTADITKINAFHKKITDINKTNRSILDNDTMSADEKGAKIASNNNKIHQIALQANDKFPPQ